MSHHSSDSDQEMSEETMKKFVNAGQKAQGEVDKILKEHLGPTGQFPHGKLTEHDEGEIAFAVLVKDGKVVIDFNHPVHWLGMTPEQAIKLGELLIKRGRNLIK
jgi:FKBP-type peptidyl-prolyl cis-trans isomerase 2